jgi:predicted  nucleic acid-binding Zn-ribbon protein
MSEHKPDFILRIELSTLDIRVHSASDHKILDAITSLKEFVMTSNAELTSQLTALKTQLDDANSTLAKSQAEITAAVTANTANVATLTQKIAELEATIAAGGSDVPPEVITAFTAAKSSADAVTVSAQALDALNPG